MEHTDVLVIGAGPIGLETAWHLRQAGLGVVQVDAGQIGQTIAEQFPPATPFFSSPERLAIAGIAIGSTNQQKPTREEYLAYLRTVALTRNLPVRTCQKVIHVDRKNGGFEVTMESPAGSRSCLQARAVVLATGGTSRPRTLGIPGEDLGHVHRGLGDPHRFFRRRVLIVGGRNSAIESALRCYRVDASVSLAYRGPAIHERVKYWLRPEVEMLIEEGRIGAYLSSVPVRIEPDAVVLQHVQTGLETRVEIDDVLLQIGFEQDGAIFRMFGVACAGPQDAPVYDPETLETGVAGVYVAGTATAGTQHRFSAYIETSHDHGLRIAAALTGKPPPPMTTARAIPEA